MWIQTYKKLFGILTFCVILIALPQVFAQPVEPKQPLEVDVYQGAELLKKVRHKYSHYKVSKGRAGWVDLNFMISADGEPYEIEVVDHSHGGDTFVNAARKAVSRYEYRPAMLGDQAVESSDSIRLRFDRVRSSYSSPSFRRVSKELYDSLENKDQEESLKLLRLLEKSRNMNLSNDAYLNYINYMYQADYGTEALQLYYLHRAVFDPQQEIYFGEDSYLELLSMLFVLKANHNYFYDAKKIYSRLAQKDNTDEVLAKFKPTIDQIDKLIKTNSLVNTQGEINDLNGWNIGLVNKSFSFEQIEGQIDELKLRCSQKYVFIEFFADKVYQMPDSYGQCRLTAIGSPGTKFILAQGG